MATTEDWLCFFDHNGIGSGWRLAHVEIGRKRVTVRLHSGSSRVLKLSVAEWAAFPKRELTVKRGKKRWISSSS
jgi:hypothetical protein